MKAVCKRVALYGMTVAAFSGCADQPKPNCLTSLNAFVMKLSEQSKSESVPGACEAAGAGLASFYEDPHVGLAPYYERDSKGQPDYRKGSVAIRTAELGNLAATAEERGVMSSSTTVLHSLGKFSTAEPDGDDICTAPTLSETKAEIPALPPVADERMTPEVNESRPAQRAVNVTRKWSNLRVYVTPDSFGTQVAAALEDQWIAPDGGTCTIRYNAMGLSPAVSCQELDPETEEPIRNLDGTFKVDPTLCDPEPNPSKLRFAGSGIGPSAKTVCDATIGYCVLAGDTFPALN